MRERLFACRIKRRRGRDSENLVGVSLSASGSRELEKRDAGERREEEEEMGLLPGSECDKGEGRGGWEEGGGLWGRFPMEAPENGVAGRCTGRFVRPTA